MIPNPGWFRMLDGASGKTPLVAAFAFAAGYMWGKSERRDGPWSRDYHHNDHRESYGKHTQREHERERDRKDHRGHGR
jgi:hypothetical protein